MPSAVVARTLISDAFARTVAAGSWGTAPLGGAYGMSDGSSGSSALGATVDGTYGRFALTNAVTNAKAALPISVRDVEMGCTLGWSALPSAGSNAFFRLQARDTQQAIGSPAFYALNLNLGPTLVLSCTYSASTVIGAPLTANASPSAADRWNLRFRVRGINPTTLEAKAWKVGTAEPGSWMIAATDNTAGMQARNPYVAVWASLGGAGATPVTYLVDDYTVSAIEPGITVLNTAEVELDFGGTIVELECDANALEITPSTEEIDLGVFCEPGATEQGRTTFTAVLSLLWSPALYTKLAAHVGELGVIRFYPDPSDRSRYVTFQTRYAAQPWGRFEVGQRVEVELPLAVLTTPDYVGELP